MEQGLYRVQFQTQLGAGAGVVVLENGRLRGGDSMIFYSGVYEQNDDTMRAEVTTDAHSQVPGMASVFGVDSVNIVLEGKVKDNVIQMTGTAPEMPEIAFQAVLTKLEG